MPGMIPLQRWEFYDVIGNETYVFEVNPKEGSTPGISKKITYQNTCGPGGRTLIFEGTDETQPLEWSGTLLEEAEYDAYMEWTNKRRQIRLTDDLDREWWIYLVQFVPKRARTVHFPWRHTYTAKATILDWPD